MKPVRYRALALAACITLSTHAAVWYVKKADFSSTEDGRSWATAYKTIQPAIDAAFNDGGGEVWVAKGVYNEPRQTFVSVPVNTGALLLRSATAIYGGFAGSEMSREDRNWNSNMTIIDGSVSRDGLNAYTVVHSSTNTILDGFIIRGGNANGDYSGTTEGAGLILEGESVAIQNCTFDCNQARRYGGGVLVLGARPNTGFVNCRFAENSAPFGGAVLCDGTTRFSHCTFTGNSFRAFAIAAGTPVISDCLFEENEGAISVGAFGHMRLYNSIFSENHSENGGAIFLGGGQYCDDLGCIYENDVEIYGCTFFNNTATSHGGAIWSVTTPLIVTNSIFWSNSPDTVFIDSVNYPAAPVTISNSIIQGGFTGVSILDQDPRFVDAASGDFRLRPDSPTIDSGADMSLIAIEQPQVTEDFDGNPRPHGAGYDIGAYEFSFARSDTNQDGAVNAVDVQAVINAVLGIGSTGNCDVNRDGQLNAIDVQITINDALGM